MYGIQNSRPKDHDLILPVNCLVPSIWRHVLGPWAQNCHNGGCNHRNTIYGAKDKFISSQNVKLFVVDFYITGENVPLLMFWWCNPDNWCNWCNPGVIGVTPELGWRYNTIRHISDPTWTLLKGWLFYSFSTLSTQMPRPGIYMSILMLYFNYHDTFVRHTN